MSQFKEHKKRIRQSARPRLLIGLTASLAIALVGFEWKTFDEVQAQDEMIVLDGITMEIPEVQPSKRKPITIPKTVVDLFDIVDTETPTSEEEPKVEIEYRPEIDYSAVEMGDEGDDPDEESIDLTGTFLTTNLSNSPHLTDCADLTDNDQRNQCTFLKMRMLVADKANYPPQARDLGIEGVVHVGFVIDENGAVSDVKITESVHRLLDNEAMRSIKLLPTFIPGMVGKHPVKVYYEMPVSFKLH